MAKYQHTLMRILRNTSFDDLIRIIFEEIQFFLKEESYLSEKNDIYPDSTNQKV